MSDNDNDDAPMDNTTGCLLLGVLCCLIVAGVMFVIGYIDAASL